MLNMSIRLFASITLMSSAALLTACGGGGKKAPATGTIEVVKLGAGTGNVSGGSINCGSACTTSGNQGATVTLTATPDSGQTFDGWRNDAASCGAATTCNVTISSSRVVAGASFSVTPTTTVSVTLGGNSMGKVTSNPTGIDCGTDCNETYLRSVGMVTLTATPTNSNNVFSGWGGACSGSQSTCTLMLNTANINAVANFQPINRSLTVSKTGSGSITSSPAGISCNDTATSDCSNDYQQGSMITLTATPGSGFIFQGWGGACAGTANCTVTMDSNKTVTATFVTSNVTLTVSKTGNGSGTVSSMPSGISCGSNCSFSFARGTSVALSAVAGGNDTFQGWSGSNCTGTAGCTVTMDNDKSVSASFTGTTTLGEFFGLTSASRIVSFDRATPGTFKTSVVVTGINAGESIVAIDTRPLDNKLYGLTSTARLVTIDPVTGAATLKSTLVVDTSDTTSPYSGINGNPGMDFNPVADRLRIVTSGGQNLRVNVDSGAVITDANVTTGAAVTDPAYTFNYNGSTGTALFVIDSASDKLRTQTVNPGNTNTSLPPDGTLTDVGALGIDVGVDGGFEIIGTNVDSFAALKASADPAAGAFYRIDLRTGAATKVADFAGTDAIISLAAPVSAAPPATGDLALLTTSGKVLTVNRAAADTMVTSVLITGLPAGETLFDLDYRPRAASTGELIVLTRDSANTGRLYRVDPATGAAVNPSTGTSGGVTVGGATPVALTGSAIGIDFNPQDGLLRIITSDDQNLIVNADTGAVTTDTAITPTAATIVAAGFTNGFVQTGGTKLYTINSTGGVLNSQGTTGGTQTAVGSLGLSSIAAPVGLDINARNNEGLLSVNESGTPKLYSVNLTTGTASGAVTLPGGETVKGISLKTPKEPEIFGLSSDGLLLRFTTGTSTAYTSRGSLSGIATGLTVIGMDFRPQTGQLIALASSGNDAKIYVVDPLNGAATLLSTLNADTNDTTAPFTFAMLPADGTYAVDFNPVVDRLRIVGGNTTAGSTSKNLRINVDTGAVTTDDNVGRPTFAISGIGFNSATTPVLYGIDSANDRLFSIDTATSAAAGTPGALTQIGALGVDLPETNGFDVRGSSEAYALAKDGAGATQLYAVNLSTAAATARTNPVALASCAGGAVGSEVRAFAASTVLADLYMIHNGSGTQSCLVRFDKDNPQITVTSLAIPTSGATGIDTAAETIIGMDFAAVTGGATETLYVVTRVNGTENGKLYTVNTSTGNATGVSGTSSTFTLPAVTGTGTRGYGVDHNRSSTSPAIRITATPGAAQIEVNTSTLSTSPALAALNQTVPLISSAAYTNSFAGASATKLYVLDTGNDSLMTQGKVNPNDGQLFDVRALGTAVANTGGFDVMGGADGYAIAVLQAGSNAYSTLYRIDLSGAAVPLTSLGDVSVTSGNTTTRKQINAMATRFTP